MGESACWSCSGVTYGWGRDVAARLFPCHARSDVRWASERTGAALVCALWGAGAVRGLRKSARALLLGLKSGQACVACPCTSQSLQVTGVATLQAEAWWAKE